MPYRDRNGRLRARLGETLDAMNLPPPAGPDVDYAVGLAAGDRTSAKRALLRGGHNKGERRGFGITSGRTEPPDPVPASPADEQEES